MNTNDRITGVRNALYLLVNALPNKGRVKKRLSLSILDFVHEYPDMSQETVSFLLTFYIQLQDGLSDKKIRKLHPKKKVKSYRTRKRKIH